MKDPLHDIEVIERYFDNALTSEETEEVTRRLQSDADFRNLFEQERTLISAIRFRGLRADLDYLKELENSQTQPRLRSKRTYWYSLAAAACVGILALILVLPAGDTTGKLFDSYFKPYPNVFEPTLRSTEVEIARARAFQAYEQGDYERASVLFKQLLNEREEAGILLLLRIGLAGLLLWAVFGSDEG